MSSHNKYGAIGLALTVPLLKQLREDAKANEMSISCFVRQLYLSYREERERRAKNK